MTFGRWSWGYLPVAAVLGLIWYEFWQSGTFTAPARRVEPSETQIAGNIVPVTPEIPAKPEVDDNFLRNPAPISLSISNATFDAAVEALRKALGDDVDLQVQNPNSFKDRKFTVDVKNASFWEVFKELNAQAPIDFRAGQNYGKDGLLMNVNGNGVYRFEANGPAILYPLTITYNRQGSGQLKAGDTADARYELQVATVVDPRIRVVGYAPVEALEATDETGRSLALMGGGGGNYTTQATNYWESRLSFSAAEPRGKRATLKCQTRFLAQLSEATVTVDDPSQKVGQSFTLGDRGMRLGRFEVQSSSVYTQVLLDIPQPTIAIGCILTDAKGKTVRFQTQSGATRTVATDGFQGPYKLTLRAPDLTRDIVLAFELKDIPLP